MKTLLTITGILLLFISAQGQVVNDRATQVNTSKALVDIMTKIQGLDNVKQNDIEGTPYLSDDWNSGSITTLGGNTFADIKLKYDLYHEQLIFQNEQTKESLLINLDKLREFNIYSEDTLRFVKNEILRNNFNAQFYQLLYSGPASLFKVQSKEVLKFDSNSASPTNNPPRLITRSALFLVDEDSFCELKKSRKKVLSCFDGHTSELEKFAKKNNINFNDEQDLVKLFKTYKVLQDK